MCVFFYNCRNFVLNRLCVCLASIAYIIFCCCCSKNYLIAARCVSAPLSTSLPPFLSHSFCCSSWALNWKCVVNVSVSVSAWVSVSLAASTHFLAVAVAVSNSNLFCQKDTKKKIIMRQAGKWNKSAKEARKFRRCCCCSYCCCCRPSLYLFIYLCVAAFLCCSINYALLTCRTAPEPPPTPCSPLVYSSSLPLPLAHPVQPSFGHLNCSWRRRWRRRWRHASLRFNGQTQLLLSLHVPTTTSAEIELEFIVEALRRRPLKPLLMLQCGQHLPNLSEAHSTSLCPTVPHCNSRYLTVPEFTSLYLTIRTSLHLTVTHSTSKYLTVSYCTSQYLTVRHRTSQYLTVPHGSSIFFTVPHCISLYLTIPHST